MPPHYSDNIGALLIGQMVSTFVYGINTLQTYMYLMRFPRDGPELRIWVLLVWLLDSVIVICVCHGLYYWAWGMVSQNSENSIAYETSAKQSFYVSAVLNLVMAAAVQGFFIKRIHRLCHARFARYTLPSIMTLLVLAHVGLGVEAMVRVVSTLQSSSLTSSSSLTFSAALPYTLLALISDVFLSGTLTIMSRGRSLRLDNSNPKLHSLLHQTVTILINRCFLLSIAALVRLIVFTMLPWTAWFIAADFIMGKLYANSFMACLNARSMFPGPDGSQIDTAIFSSVPDVSVRSNASVIAGSYAPTPHAGRPASRIVMQRTVSLPELVVCKDMGKYGVPVATLTDQDICAGLIATARP